MINQRVVMIGNGGHSRVLLDILRLRSIELFGIISCNVVEKDPLYLGNDDTFIERRSQYKDCILINGIGSTKDVKRREEVYTRYKNLGFAFMSVIHPNAIISENCVIGEGVQIMAGAIVQPACNIKENCIINTVASIDHDCVIGAHTHIAPGCVLSGGVLIGASCHIGTGSVMIQSLKIGDNVLIGAGSVVIWDIPENHCVKGNPAK